MNSVYPITIINEMQVPAARVQLVNYPPKGPDVQIMHRQENHWLDLSLTSRPLNARANYLNHWEPARFETIGKVFLVPKGEMLRTQGEGNETQTSLVCQLQPDILQRWVGRDVPLEDMLLSTYLNINDGNIFQLLTRLARELQNPGFGSDTLVELISAQIAIELGRFCHSIKIEPIAPQRGLSRYLLSRIRDRLHEVKPPPSLDELAEICNMSVRHLTRAYRASTDHSIGEHIAQIRMQHAVSLLQTDISIKAIAYTLGFKSSASFCHAFRKASGVTPGEYRRRQFTR